MTTRKTDAEGTLALFGGALTAALQWRLLLLWTVGLMLPTLAIWLPTWHALGGLYDFSPRAAEIARRFDMLAFEDTVIAFGRAGGALAGASLFAVVLAALTAPFLAGVTAAAARQRGGAAPLRLVALVQGGAAFYGRMFRLALVSLVPLGAAGAVASVAFKLADKRAETATLQSQAERAGHVALAVTLIVFVLLHATVEAARAQLIADERLRSAWRAWARGLRLTVARPLPVLALYVGAMLAGTAVAAVPLLVRLRLTPASGVVFWLGFLLTQLGVAAVGWGRAGRLFALAAVAADARPAAASAPPASAAPAPTEPDPAPSA